MLASETIQKTIFLRLQAASPVISHGMVGSGSEPPGSNGFLCRYAWNLWSRRSHAALAITANAAFRPTAETVTPGVFVDWPGDLTGTLERVNTLYRKSRGLQG